MKTIFEQGKCYCPQSSADGDKCILCGGKIDVIKKEVKEVKKRK